jgi:uncharacterized membrane protein YkoI
MMINRQFFFVNVFLLFIGLNSIAISQNRMSLEQAVNQVKQQNNGRIISANTQRDRDQRTIHNIRLLTPKGQVKRYQINERTGQNIRSQEH